MLALSDVGKQQRLNEVDYEIWRLILKLLQCQHILIIALLNGGDPCLESLAEVDGFDPPQAFTLDFKLYLAVKSRAKLRF